jgi:DNA-binding CsgD family transcriptional regulator
MSVPHGWLFLTRESVPEPWRERAVDIVMVPLTQVEEARILEAVAPELDADQQRLVNLVAQGLSAGAVARRLSMPQRTVEHHLSRLCDRFGARSTAELSALLARRGF